MAETQTGSQTNISDIPEELRGLRRALLTAATIRAFDPRFIASQFGGDLSRLFGGTTTGTTPPGGGGGPVTDTRTGDPTLNATALGVRQGTPIRGGGSAQQFAVDPTTLAQLMRQLEDNKNIPMGTKMVNLNNVGLPINGTSPYPVNNPVGGGIGAPVIVGSNGQNSPNFNPYTGYTYHPPPIPTIDVTNPPIYGNPPPGGGGNPPPGGGPGGGLPPPQLPPDLPTIDVGPPGFQPIDNGRDPLRPAHVPGASWGTPHDPSLTPAQIQQNNSLAGITPGGAGQAGNLPAGSSWNPQQYASDALAQQIAASLGAQVAHTNPQGPFGVPPQNLLDFGIGGSGNMLNAGLVNSMLTDPGQQPFAARRLQDELNYLNRTSDFYGGAPVTGGPQQPLSGVMAGLLSGGNYANGGGIRRYDVGGAIPGLDMQTNSIGSGPNTTGSDIADNPAYPYAPYTPYEDQRFVDWREHPAEGNLATSEATRAAESGAAHIPSVFDEYGGIAANRDAEGRATSNFGIANDQMEWAGSQTGNAMAGYGDIYERANQIGGASFAPTEFSTSAISNPNLLSAGQISIDPLRDYRMQNPLSWTDQGVQGSYMNPYMDAVAGVQRTRAIDDFREQRGARNSAAVNAGAFGGSRAAVQEGVAQRALNRNLQSIDANALNQAYTNAQGQFNTDRGAMFNANNANLNAALQTQGLATQAGLSAAQSNQGANVQQFSQYLQAQQEAERMRNQFGLQGQQLTDASRQAAARLGLDAAGLGGSQALSAMQGLTGAAGQLSNIGRSRAELQGYGQQLEQSRLGALQQTGAIQDARAQQNLDYGYQSFMNQQNWPFQLANFYQGQLSGVPIGVNQEAVQYQTYSPLSQLGGALTAGIGAIGSARQS